jgi:peptidoglycan/xylan/chitin deacetylase (PgdA/CDA1 family)
VLLEFAKDPGFWEKAKHWQAKGWRIALHGYEHVYSTNCAGINPVHDRSEFAGLSLEIQREKIREGVRILKDNGLNPTAFFAPSHTFDENTLEALRLESDIRIISDTVANDTYCHNGFTFIPQQAGRVRELPFKLTTVCLHPNFATNPEFDEIEAFLKAHPGEFLDPNAILPTSRRRSILDRGYEMAYFLKRKLRK